MPPATLRQTFIRKTSDLLMRGVLDKCVVNPFSFMPSSIVQDILNCVWTPKLALSRTSIASSRLLLTSGKLEHVDLPSVKYQEDTVTLEDIDLSRLKYAEDSVTLLRMLSRGCQNLRTLSAIRIGTMEAERAFQELLPNCAKLEHLHSGMYFHPDDLRNCGNLKTLRLHFEEKEIDFFCRCITFDFLKRHRSLEVFASCHRIEVEEYVNTYYLHDAAVSILDNCPQLTSMGFLDSSAAVQQLHDRDLKNLRTPRRFQLRKCYWDVGKRSWQTGVEKSEYCEMTRVAALSCPHTEALVIEVIDASSLRHLKALNNLSDLSIIFTGDKDEIDVRELHLLLEEIGPQLRHLAIPSGFYKQHLNLNIVFRNCPNLSTLQCSMTVDENIQPCANLMSLEKLSVGMCHKVTVNGLIFLLSSCPKLKVLKLHTKKELDDGVMQTVLRKNPFAELEVAHISGCSLSESGLRRFIQSAVKLKNYSIHSYSLEKDDVVRCVRELNPSAVCPEPKSCFEFREDTEFIREDTFPRRLDSSCCL